MTILEVMGAGVPVVATAVGGVPEVVSAPRTGWLVQPENPKALASVVCEAVGNKREKTLRADSGRARVKRLYGPVPWTRRHLEIYSHLPALAGKVPQREPSTSRSGT